MNAVITSVRLATTGPFSGSYLYGWKQQVPKLLADGYEDPASFRSGSVTSDTVFESPAFEINNKSVLVGTNVELKQRGYVQDQLCFEFQARGIAGNGIFFHVARWDLAGDGLENTNVTIGSAPIGSPTDSTFYIFTPGPITSSSPFIMLEAGTTSRMVMTPQGGLGTTVTFKAVSASLSTPATVSLLVSDASYQMVMEANGNFSQIDFSTGKIGSAYDSNVVATNTMGFFAGTNDNANPYLPYPWGSVVFGDVMGAWFGLVSNAPSAGNTLCLFQATGYAHSINPGTVNTGLSGTLAPGAKASGGIIYDLGSGTYGTVTSISIVTANGISGTVATATTTPAITLTLGAITPTSVNGITLSGSGSLANSGTSSLTGFTGSGSSSGTNTGDQTSVSGSSGSCTGNAATATALQTGRTINGTTFDGTANITITSAAGTLTGTTLNATVVNSSLTSVGTLTGGATGAGFTIALSTSTITGTLPSGHMPAFGSGDVSFASGGGAGTIAAGAVTLPKMANVATSTVFYRKTAGTGSPEVNTLATLKTDLGLTGTNSGDQTITLTGDATGSGTGSFAVTLAASGVTATTYGSATSIPIVTVDAKGRITNAVNASTALGVGMGLRGHIDGLQLSNSGPGFTVGYTAGTCRDSTDAFTLSFSAGTKKIGSTWTAGSGNNGLDTGSPTNGTWYHVWAIAKADGSSADILFSTSATAPTMPSTYTLKRLIGTWFIDGGGSLATFQQDGDVFMWNVPVQDVAATNPGTTAVTRTLSVPNGLRVEAILAVGTYDNGVAGADASFTYISDLSISDQAAGNAAFNVGIYSATSSTAGGNAVRCFTNTSKQVRSRCNNSTANTSLYIVTLGWVHPRGKNQ